VLSHLPHVAKQVPQQVAELVSECERDVTKGVHCVVESYGYSLQPISSSEQNMMSLGIPFSDWLNENVSQLVAEHVSSVNGSRTQVEQQVAELVASVNGSVEQHGEYKFSNKFSNLLLNLLSNMWLV